ncbi:MAG: AmmeMemoRadiSam system protein B [Deltaproteobacteria bacterium]|nr:AmmeMemoRadiSam system protein B [Deltaproteobacteria bacterium]
MTRRPAVAGQFYPGTAERLAAFLREAVPHEPAPVRALGVVAPHAGYIYSGGVAGKVFGRVLVPDTVVLLGPNHTGLGTPASILSRGTWLTPLGPVPVAEALADALKAACPLLEEDALAHAHEHSLEVELPFLQHRNPSVQIVPIAFLLRGADDIEEVGEAIGGVLAGWPEPVLLVASSDMTHYEPHAVAQRKDAEAIERVLALDPRGLLETTRSRRISMCGVIPTAVLLTAARRLGATRGELVAYATSGETSGDYERVVGYAGMLVV